MLMFRSSLHEISYRYLTLFWMDAIFIVKIPGSCAENRWDKIVYLFANLSISNHPDSSTLLHYEELQNLLFHVSLLTSSISLADKEMHQLSLRIEFVSTNVLY